MNLSNHWMAMLYTNAPASPRRGAPAGCWAQHISADPRGSGHRDLTGPVNNVHTSLSCLAVNCGQSLGRANKADIPKQTYY